MSGSSGKCRRRIARSCVGICGGARRESPRRLRRMPEPNSATGAAVAAVSYHFQTAKLRRGCPHVGRDRSRAGWSQFIV